MPITQEDQLKHSLRTQLCDQAVAIRSRRRVVEEKWLRSRRNWMGLNSGAYKPADTEAGPYNVPSGRRVLERICVRATKLMTPSVKWFEVAPMGNYDQEMLSNVDHFMWYVIRKKTRSRTNISQLARCMLLYGRPILKTTIMVRNGQVWPYQRVVDPFSFFTFPETATSLEDAEVLFEDYLMSYERYRTFVDKGILDDYRRDDFTAPTWPYHLTERLAYQGITDPGVNVDVVINRVSGELERSGNGYVSLTEEWLTREDKLYQVYIAWNLKAGPRIVGFFQSQYDEPLYRSTSHRSLPNETYTNAQSEDLNELDLLQNDLFNMFIAASEWEQGFVMEDTAQSGGIRHDSHRMKGRALWHMNGDPRELAQFFQPPNTSSNFLRSFQTVWGLLQGVGGNGGLAEGYPGRNMPRAGFAAQSLIDLGMADIQDVAEIIEQEVLTPGLADIYKVSQFIPDTQLMRIPGGQAMYGSTQSDVLRKQDVIGDYEFEWIGSMQFQDESARGQRLMVFANMLMQPQTQAALAQQGMMVNWGELLPMIWRYGLGERGLNRVLIKTQPPAAQAATSGQPAQQPPSGAGGNGAGVSVSQTGGAMPTGLNIQRPTITTNMGMG